MMALVNIIRSRTTNTQSLWMLHPGTVQPARRLWPWSSAYCGMTAPVYNLSSHATSFGARGDTTAISSPVVGCRNSMRCACRK